MYYVILIYCILLSLLLLLLLLLSKSHNYLLSLILLLLLLLFIIIIINIIIIICREIFRVLELMKLDLANFTLSLIKPHLKQHSVEIERKKFLEILKIQQRAILFI